jgi:hypothetical protein
MSVLDGPGEGTWSVFALKVVEERDELRHKLAGEAAHIKSLEGLLVDAVRERDEARAALARTDRARRDSENAWEEEYDAMKRERDELKTRLAHAEADAEQAIHNEAFMERQRIVAWIRARHAQGSADCSLSLMALDALRVMADEIERGEHER